MTKQLSEVLETFANQTTMHGVPKVIFARSMAGRLFWSVICLSAGALFIANLFEIINRYLSYPKKVTVDMLSMPVQFPAVSICNMRNLDFYYLNLLNRKFIESEGNPLQDVNSTDGFIREYMRYSAKFGPLFNDRWIQANYSKEFQDIFSRTTLSSNIPTEIISTAAIQLEEFVVKCYFRGLSCNISHDFSTFFDSYYYNCFTYNAPREIIDGETQQSSSEGIDNGWSTVLLTGSGMLDKNPIITVLPGLLESKSPISASDGVRVVIHPPDTNPFPLTEGYDVPPGFSVSLGIRPRRNIRIGLPYGNCTNVNPFNGSPRGYRIIDCMRMCLQSHVMETCDCFDSTLPELPVGDSRTMQPCRKDNFLADSCMFEATNECLWAMLNLTSRIQCARRKRNDVMRDMKILEACECHPPCDEITYDVTYSLSKWPAVGYEGDSAYLDIFFVTEFLRRFEFTPKNETVYAYFDVSQREKKIQDFARLNVYIADSDVSVTQESSDYVLSQLVSDIGGQLGLWVGISVITITEVLELGCTLIGTLSYIGSSPSNTQEADRRIAGHLNRSDRQNTGTRCNRARSRGDHRRENPDECIGDQLKDDIQIDCYERNKPIDGHHCSEERSKYTKEYLSVAEKVYFDGRNHAPSFTAGESTERAAAGTTASGDDFYEAIESTRQDNAIKGPTRVDCNTLGSRKKETNFRIFV